MSIGKLLYLDDDGLHRPTYPELLQYLTARARDIYGPAVSLDAATPDGQMLAVFAEALYDCSELCGAVYNSLAPSTADPAALRRNVAINGITPGIGSLGSVDIEFFGEVGTRLDANAITVGNSSGERWVLGANLVIPASGSIIGTCYSTEFGGSAAEPATVTRIHTPIRGLARVSNPTPGVPGGAPETTVALRLRQRESVSHGSSDNMTGLIAAVRELGGVSKVFGASNPTSSVDANGLPANAMQISVVGGDATEIAQVIAARKGPGAPMVGNTTVTVQVGSQPLGVKFMRPGDVGIEVQIDLLALPGWLSTTGDQMRQQIVDWIQGADIAARLRHATLTRVVDGVGDTYDAFSVKWRRAGAGAYTEDSIQLSISEVASINVSNITITVHAVMP